MSKINNNTTIRSESLDLLRFPLAVIIVVVHVFGAINDSSLPVFNTVNSFIDAFLRGQSVPIYYFISGYVFFLGISDYTLEKYKSKLINRVKTLLIPYMIWNIFLVIINFLKRSPPFAIFFPNIHSVEIDMSIPAILNVFWNSSKGIFQYLNVEPIDSPVFPINSPLWFIRELMIVVLLTPIIFKAIKYMGNSFVVFIGILWIVIPYFSGESYSNQFLTALFFFSFGSIMSIKRKDMVHEFYRLFKASIIVYPILCILYLILTRNAPDLAVLIKKVKFIVGLLFAYNLSVWMLRNKKCKVNSFLASASFFIYISHYLLIHDIQKILMKLWCPQSDLALLAVYILTVIITIASLLLIFKILKRYFPSLLCVITGRR